MRYASWDQPFQFQPSGHHTFQQPSLLSTMLFVFWMVMWFGMIILYSGWHILCFELCIWHFRQHLRKNLFAFLIRCFVFFMIYLFLDGIYFRGPICIELRPQGTCRNFIGLKKPPISFININIVLDLEILLFSKMFCCYCCISGQLKSWSTLLPLVSRFLLAAARAPASLGWAGRTTTGLLGAADVSVLVLGGRAVG